MKHILFDLGNVLVSFRPQAFLHELFEDERIIDACMYVYFNGLWNEYDKGIYNAREMVAIGVKQYPSYADAFSYMLSQWVRFVRPIDQIVAHIDSLQEKGYDLYILSNLPEDCYNYLKSRYSFMQRMEGVFSFQEKMIKPDPRLFMCLFQRYHLDPGDCLFIDDHKENIDTAQTLGCETFWCTSTDALVNWLERVENESVQ